MKKMATKITAAAARPPMTPPTMAPTAMPTIVCWERADAAVVAEADGTTTITQLVQFKTWSLIVAVLNFKLESSSKPFAVRVSVRLDEVSSE